MERMKNLENEFDAVISNYHSRLRAGDISLNTRRAADNSLLKLKKYWGHLTPDKLTKEMWQKFQIKYDSKIGGTQFNLTKFMVVFAKHLSNKGLLSRSPEIKNMFSRRERDARRKKKNWLFTREQIEDLDKACETDKERLGIRLGYLLAFRISDVVRLSWGRIVLDAKVPYIEFSGGDDKAGFVGRCPLPNEIVELLGKLDKEGKWVFPQVRDKQQHLITQQFPFNEIKSRSGIKKGGFHDLRRYRLSADFKNPKLTPALVCKTRRISMQVAMENYIRTNEDDLATMLRESV